MNTRIFSVLAAIAMSSAAAIPAMAHDTRAEGATPPATASTGTTQAGTTQSAQAVEPSRGDAVYGSPSGSPDSSSNGSLGHANDDNDATGVIGVKVGNGPGYAWWKDR